MSRVKPLQGVAKGGGSATLIRTIKKNTNIQYRELFGGKNGVFIRFFKGLIAFRVLLECGNAIT